jgi:hypothetical protein
VFNFPSSVANYLNRGDTVAAELDAPPPARCFVRIRPVPKPGVPRENPHRYLNSPYGLFEYWEFAFRRMVLRAGWESDEWNYDRYLEQDESCQTSTEAEFHAVVQQWIPDPGRLRHVRDSSCPE